MPIEARTHGEQTPLIQVLFGTKAEAIKLAPVLTEMDKRGVPYRLVETGQHGGFLPGLRVELGLREPDVCLGGDRDADTVARAVIWGIRLAQRLASAQRLRDEVFGNRDGVCLVHGDTPSTLLSALMARRAGLRVAHLESGLRSHSWRHPFPEELIRVAVMRLSHVLFAPDGDAVANLEALVAEGRVRGRVVATSANTGVEALRSALGPVGPGVAGSGPVVATMHRVENLHDDARFEGFLALLGRLARPAVFVVHPPTEAVLSDRGGRAVVEDMGVATSGLVPYGEFTAMLAAAPYVVTDGGSIQEECARLGVPTLLWRDRTERPDGIGANVVLARYDDDVVGAFLADPQALRRPVALGDERPSAEVVDVLVDELEA
ncbi:MAG: UDP-N-acetylglucosamine 2-epimerase, partial [Acidimicrobiales bacterium]|nr:UDP-N-acetylglucosamine 2-epimerase [Acidimicrobiales bacterium]